MRDPAADRLQPLVPRAAGLAPRLQLPGCSVRPDMSTSSLTTQMTAFRNVRVTLLQTQLSVGDLQEAAADLADLLMVGLLVPQLADTFEEDVRDGLARQSALVLDTMRRTSNSQRILVISYHSPAEILLLGSAAASWLVLFSTRLAVARRRWAEEARDRTRAEVEMRVYEVLRTQVEETVGGSLGSAAEDALREILLRPGARAATRSLQQATFIDQDDDSEGRQAAP